MPAMQQPGMQPGMPPGMPAGMVYMPMGAPAMPQQQWQMVQGPWMGHYFMPPSQHHMPDQHLNLMAAGRSSSAPEGPLAFRAALPTHASGAPALWAPPLTAGTRPHANKHTHAVAALAARFHLCLTACHSVHVKSKEHASALRGCSQSLVSCDSRTVPDIALEEGRALETEQLKQDCCCGVHGLLCCTELASTGSLQNTASSGSMPDVREELSKNAISLPDALGNEWRSDRGSPVPSGEVQHPAPGQSASEPAAQQTSTSLWPRSHSQGTATGLVHSASTTPCLSMPQMESNQISVF